jgi:protein-S-isoprenylcysteine O-methyltransferase Ste14
LQLYAYFQIICLLFFLLLFLGRTLYLRVRRDIVVFSLGVGKRGFQQVVEVLFFAGLCVWMAEVLLYALSAPVRLRHGILSVELVDAAAARAGGAALIVLSLALFVWALASFGESWRVGIDTEKPGGLVKRGAFGISRNPIFLFLDLYFLGTFLLNGALVFLLFAVAITGGLHYQILQEERFLKTHYGAAYEGYCAQTRRYLGRRRIDASAVDASVLNTDRR